MKKKLLATLLLGCIVSFSGLVQAGEVLYVPVSNALQIVDCSRNAVIETVPAYNDFIASAMYSPDGKRYYACGWHSIYVFDTTTDKLVDTYNFSSELNRVTIGACAVSTDGSTLYIAASIVKRKQNIPRLNVLPPQIVAFDLKKREIIRSYEVPSAISGVFPIRKDPHHLILLGLDVFKLDLRKGKVEKIMGMLNPDKGQQEVRNIILNNTNSSPGDHGVLALPYYSTSQAGIGKGYLIIDTNTGKLSLLKGEDIWFEYSARVSPDKKYIYAVLDELVKIDMKTGKTLKFTTADKGTYTAVAVSQDGKKIYAGPYGADISIYDAESLKLIGVIPLEADGRVSTLISR